MSGLKGYFTDQRERRQTERIGHAPPVGEGRVLASRVSSHQIIAASESKQFVLFLQFTPEGCVDVTCAEADGAARGFRSARRRCPSCVAYANKERWEGL